MAVVNALQDFEDVSSTNKDASTASAESSFKCFDCHTTTARAECRTVQIGDTPAFRMLCSNCQPDSTNEEASAEASATNKDASAEVSATNKDASAEASATNKDSSSTNEDASAEASATNKDSSSTNEDASAATAATNKDVSATAAVTKESMYYVLYVKYVNISCLCVLCVGEDDDPESDEDVLYLAFRLKLKTLSDVSADFYIPQTSEEWKAHIPGWQGKDKKRGLGAWSGTRLCHQVVQKAIQYYAEHIGAPPVMTGVCPIHTHNTYTQYMHTIHAYNAYIQYIYTIHAYNTYTQYMHTIHTHNTCIQYIHTIHNYNVLHNTHRNSSNQEEEEKEKKNKKSSWRWYWTHTETTCVDYA